MKNKKPSNSKLTNKQKTELNKIRRFVEKEKKRVRIYHEPRYSYTIDARTEKIILCYSIPYDGGLDKKGKPKIKYKQKKRYFPHINLGNWKSHFDRCLQQHYDWITEEQNKELSSIKTDEDSLLYWIEKYSDKDRSITKTLSIHTIRADKLYLMGYYDWLKINKPRMLGLWSHTGNEGKKTFEEYLKYKKINGGVRKKKWSDGSLSSCYRRTRAFFNWISMSLDDFPTGVLSNMKIKKPRPITRTFTQMEARKVIDFMNEQNENFVWEWFIPILRILMTTGCRLGECLNMKINDLVVDERKWNLTRTKSGRPRVLEIDDDISWQYILDRIYDDKGKISIDKDYVFHRRFWKTPNIISNGKNRGGGWNEDLSKPFSGSGVEHKFKKMLKFLKINEKLTPHDCRRFFITEKLKETKGNVPLVAQLVGHKSWEMVNHYAQSLIDEDTRTTLDLSLI